MARRFSGFAGLALALLLAACGAEDREDSAGAPEDATGFVTANVEPPPGARDSRGDGVLRDGDGRPYGYGLLNAPLPGLDGPLAGGAGPADIRIDQWTIVYVWGIWCADCRADAPYVEALYRAVQQDPGLDFLSVHVPPSAARADEAYGRFGSVEAYFEAEGYRYPVIIDEDAALRERLQIAWTPTYLLVSPDGIVEAFRTDLSVAGDQPVKTFLQDVAEVRRGWTAAAAAGRKAGAGPAGTLSIGPDGIAGLDGKTAFERAAIAAAFPGLRIDGGTQQVEGEPYPVFHVRVPGDPAEATPRVTLEPSWDRAWVHAALTRHDSVSGPDGARIGEMRLADLSPEVRETCEPGLEAYGDMLICNQASDDGRFAWIFGAPAEFDGFYPDAAPQVRNNGVLVEMRYLPSRPAGE